MGVTLPAASRGHFFKNAVRCGAKSCGFLVAIFAFVGSLGCQTSRSSREIMEERQGQAHPSADTLWTDLFYMSQPESPERPVEHWQFFYKDCEIARRNRYPSRSDWECRAPH